MQFKVDTSFMDKTDFYSKRIRKNLMDGLQDVTSDLSKTAQGSAPKKEGILEASARFEVTEGMGGAEGTVGFSAYNNATGFNYAEWTHNAKYDLGKRSRRKSGGKSKYGDGAVPVGSGYLKNSLEMNQAGYNKHLRDKYRDAIK